ncbi:MAG: helix-turn-helix domain-containing protein, partial [Anaerolineales bacterium]|nr:helix-turn-helix domain-containing protein [Anaerolineales bacterium]
MTPQTVGHALSQQRQQRGLTLEQASEATHIRRHYLQALEAGDFGALPSAAQVRGFLRAYASYLDLDGEALLAQLRQPSASDPAPAAGAPPAAAQPTRPAPEPAAARAEPAPPAASGDFAHIAEQLRGRREQVQLTLAEVEQNTHIPEHYLRRLEAGDYDSFPSPTQARGMLGNYAEFLGLESEALLLQYAEVLQARF